MFWSRRRCGQFLRTWPGLPHSQHEPLNERGLSRKFRSAENFGPGPIFSENFGPVGPILSEKKGPCPKKKVRRFISYVHVVDISLRVMAEIEETVDDGSDCDDLVEEAYAYLVSKMYPECVSETKKRVIRRKAAKLTISVEGELLYKHKQGKEKVSSV